MDHYRNRSRETSEAERGTVIVFVTIALTALIGLAAWSTETGRVWQTKSQLQVAADSSALAGAGNLFSADFLTVDEAAARTAAITYGAQHRAADVNNLTIAAADVEVGSWTMATETFTALPGNTDPDVVRAVRVAARRDDTANGEMNTILGRAMGVDSIAVNTDAIAYWGFAGRGVPGTVDLPIAIDCCQISGSRAGSVCSENYCRYISNAVPNPCLLSTGETTSCLEFHSNPEQNACWTAFKTDSPSVSTPDMTQIVQNGNSTDIGDQPIYIDNGTKTPVVQDIKDRFDAEGIDLSDPVDGTKDSWVVTLPVIECQNPGDGCASGDPQHIIGFLCMDIREIIVTPDKIIKGDFLCSTDPRCDTIGFGPGGTIAGSISADYPVIVN
jgi:hypothetical protein